MTDDKWDQLDELGKWRVLCRTIDELTGQMHARGFTPADLADVYLSACTQQIYAIANGDIELVSQAFTTFAERVKEPDLVEALQRGVILRTHLH